MSMPNIFELLRSFTLNFFVHSFLPPNFFSDFLNYHFGCRPHQLLFFHQDVLGWQVRHSLH